MMTSEPMKARLIPENAVPMDHWDANTLPHPTQAIIYQLSIAAKEGNGNRDVDLSYSAAKAEVGISNHGDFLARMERLISPTGCNGDIGSTRPRRTRDPHAGSGNNRSKDTRLSIDWNVRGLSYVVIKLDSGRNWQFASNFHPYMMHRDDQHKGCFFAGSRFDRAGRPIAPGINADSSTFAYFIVDGALLDRDANGEFQHRFNIHIELLEMDGAAIDNRIPIIIDPDVRHPGGNGDP